MSEVQLIQRHAGERTQELGLQLAEAEYGFSAASAISAGPFPDTLARALEVAAESDARWTIMLDGDVLVLPGSIRRLIDLADRYPNNHFVISASVLDKFFGTVRPGGIRAYRTRLIPKALADRRWADRIRPETALMMGMAERGNPSHSTCLLAGIHDFEQYYTDVFRTAVVQGVKFRSRIPRLIARWERCAKTDADFLVAIAGARHGLSLDDVRLDAALFRASSDETLDRLGLREKTPLPVGTPADVCENLDERLIWLRRSNPFTRAFPEFASKMAWREGQPPRLRRIRLLGRHRNLLLRRSPIRIDRLW